MAAEKLRGTLLTGIVSAGFTVIVIFVVVTFTNIGDKILNAASVDYVDGKAAEIEQKFEKYKVDHTEVHQAEQVNIVDKLDTIIKAVE